MPASKRLQELEEKTERLDLSHDTFSRNTRVQLKQVFKSLRELMTLPKPPNGRTARRAQERQARRQEAIGLALLLSS